MKRLHVHVSVDDLSQAVKFYSTLFAAQPTVTKSDYAKWMLDDPRVNFAISMRGAQPGLNHLGIQVESQEELHEVYDRLRAADAPMIEQGQTQCCYHRSEKAWIDDPAGISWEAFYTTGEATVYGDRTGERSGQARHVPEKTPVATEARVSAASSSCCGASAAL
jgi:hypothetical protein